MVNNYPAMFYWRDNSNFYPMPFFMEEPMPLDKSKTFKKNVKTEVKAGKPVKQAVAIAYKATKKKK